MFLVVGGNGPVGGAVLRALDLGAAGTALMLGEGHDEQVVEATGPERVTCDEVARRFAAVLGRPVRYRPISLQELRGGMERAGLPAPLIEALVETWDHMASGGMAAPATDAVVRLTGAPPARHVHRRPRRALRGHGGPVGPTRPLAAVPFHRSPATPSGRCPGFHASTLPEGAQP